MDAILDRQIRLQTASAVFDPLTQTDLVAEANHRIANSLTLLVSMVRMQAVAARKKAETFTGTEVRQILEGVAARISTISELHRLLSQNGDSETVALRPQLKRVTDGLVEALGCAEQQVRVMHTGVDCMVLTRLVQPLVLILCEVFINAMKYAHPAGVPLIMMVDCNAAADGRLVISISDDGVGLPEGFDPALAKGLGFRVMRGLASEIGGELQIMSTHLGLTFRLSLPEAAMAGTQLT